MSSKKGAMKKKLENMNLGKRINYGYKMVITMMLISGLLSNYGFDVIDLGKDVPEEDVLNCVIDHTQCVGCGICKEMCKLGAICD